MASQPSNHPLHGIVDVDWAGLAPTGGKAIPGLLRGLCSTKTSVSSALQLGEILTYTMPGHFAASRAVPFLAHLACHPQTPRPYDVLSLLHELAAGVPGDRVPRFPDTVDIEAWRAEVTWVRSVGKSEAKQYFREQRDAAPNEQQRRRMVTQLAVLEQSDGQEALAAELATYEAIDAEVPRLLRLLTEPELRAGEFVPQEAANLLALFPQHAATIIPALRELQGASAVDDEDFASALYAIGMLAQSTDTDSTTYLEGFLAGESDDPRTVAAAVGVIHQLHDKAPEQAVTVLTPWIADPELAEVFPSPFADVNDHGYLLLTAGLLGERGRAARIAAYPTLFEESDPEAEDPSPLLADALELAFGARSAQHASVEPEAFDTFDAECQEVLWAVTELPAAAWKLPEVVETLTAWGLPSKRNTFLSFTGAGESDSPGDSTPGQSRRH